MPRLYMGAARDTWLIGLVCPEFIIFAHAKEVIG